MVSLTTPRQRALHRLPGGLRLELGADIVAAAGVKGALQRVALPAKDVVAALRVAVPAGSRP